VVAEQRVLPPAERVERHRHRDRDDHTGTVKASLSIGGLREPILGEGSSALELALGAAAEISRTLGHDQTG
jgi:hypothetical protein